MEGYGEFLKLSWMESILNSQAPEGCYGDGSSNKGRAKREANSIEYGCVDHTTGLGASTLSAYLRFLSN